MPVLGIVAAADVAALPAQAQVHPAVTGLQAFFAAPRVALAGLDRFEMRAVGGHGGDFDRTSILADRGRSGQTAAALEIPLKSAPHPAIRGGAWRNGGTTTRAQVCCRSCNTIA